jgi:transcription antitermination factor NusG
MKREAEFNANAIPECRDTARWYCVMVRQNWMASVEGELYALGHRTFTPKTKRWRSHARRLTAVERPIHGMGSYLFVEIDYPRQPFSLVRETRGVIEIMSTGGRPIPFSRNDVLAFLTRYLKGEWDEIAKEPKLPIGARVMVVEGPHENKTAIVTALKGKKIFAKVEDQVHPSVFFASGVRAA